MIPISLTIKGLYSYREETFIDFSNLTLSGLFGIFGAVGSGKSAILEAISFALYGETERLNKADKRSYNMMNLRSKQLFIEFVFSCGDCNHKYRFTVNAKRNSKNFGDGGKIDRQAYMWNGTWIPTEVDAEKVLGLSYDNFKRTVIIPQGKFQEFLQLKESERVQMLKEIFNLEKFELSPKVASLAKENDLKVSHLQGQMQGLPLYDEELLKAEDEQINQLQTTVWELGQKITKLQSEDKVLVKLKSLFTDVDAKTSVLNALERGVAEIDRIDRYICEFEKCEQVFKHRVENRDRLNEAAQKQQQEAEKLHGHQIKLTAQIASETAKVLKLKDEYVNRDVLLQKAIELKKIIAISRRRKEVSALSSRIEKGEIAVEREEKLIQTIKEQLAGIKNDIASAEQALPDTALLISISNWFRVKEQLRSNVQMAEQELARATAKVLKVKAEIEIELKKLPAEVQLPDFPERLTIVKSEAERVVAGFNLRLQILQQERNHLNVLQKLDELAQQLTNGQPCPLCGSLHHPHVLSSVDIEIENEQRRTKIADIEERKNSLTAIILNLSALYSSYETYCSEISLKQHEVQKQNESFSCHTRSFSFAGYPADGGELVNQQLSELEKKNFEIRKLRKLRDIKEKELELVNANILTYRTGVETLKTGRAQQDGQIDTLKAQLSLVDLSNEIDKPEAELTGNVEELNRRYLQVTHDFEHADKALQADNKALAILTGRAAELQKQIILSNRQLHELNEEIKNLLAGEGYATEEAVAKVLSIKPDIKKEKQRIEEFRKKLHAATVQLAEALGKIEGKEYNEQQHGLLIEELEKLSGELALTNEKLITKKNVVEHLRQQMETRQKLQKDIENLLQRAENLKILTNLFRTSGFVNYVSSVYLQNLVNSANQRFYRMTRQKLMLELADDNSFRVKDFMNNGEVRSVKTLSGGQTFQAALSLALALADNIQHLTRSKQNFFFLDEGFGSLDKDALAVVFDTLKALRKENRIVGVISHVDEMQQEIPVSLKITNDVERGSLVAESWN